MLLFSDDRYNSRTVAIWAHSILITLVEYPSMSAVETRLGQDGGREGWKLDHRCYRELPHKFFCNLYARYPCAVITPIYEQTKDCRLRRRHGSGGLSKRKTIFVTQSCYCLSNLLLVIQDRIHKKLICGLTGSVKVAVCPDQRCFLSVKSNKGSGAQITTNAVPVLWI